MSLSRLPKLPARQRGVALAIGLIILVVLTLLGISILQVANLQERMSRNMRDQMVAFQAAEAALRAAEDLIESGVSPYDNLFDAAQFTTACTGGRCRPTGSPQWEVAANWTGTLSNQVSTLSLPAGAANPRYITELVTVPIFDTSLGCTLGTFRITAQGYGPGGALVTLQTIYRYRPHLCPE